jgi:AAA15 family ATPase/GTPase
MSAAMLIRFGVSNHLSFRDYHQFSMVASSTLKEESAYRLQVDGLDDPLLPIAIIFGANASGKTNLLASWDNFIAIILHSHRTANQKKDINREYFRLDEEMLHQPTRFDCDVMIGGVRHHYGFMINNKMVLEEWLYVYPGSRRQVWYHRKQGESPEFYFGPHLKGKKQTLAEFTSPNNLFISIAASNAHPQLSNIRDYFRDNYITLYSTHLNNPLQFRPGHWESDESRHRLVHFLAEGDTGVVDMIFEDVTTQQDIVKTFKLGHRDKNNNIIYFKPGLESKGTLALMQIAEALFTVLDKGGTLWIDELSAHLHPTLVHGIISLFGNPETNPKQAQLICITHDAILLNSPVIHRDQVWFTEKGKDGASRLFPLSDFQVRSRDNVQKEYLRGVYGGVPYLGTPGRLLGQD